MEIMSYQDAQVRQLDNRTMEELYTSKLGYVREFDLKTGGHHAFIVDLRDDGAVVHPHFHNVDQFQVVIRGEGKLGARQIEPITFHYADAYTPYGPISGRKEGVEFFTLRLADADGFHPMPGSRNKLPGKPGRNLQGVFTPGKPGPGRESLIGPTEDGMEVACLRLAPGAAADDGGIEGAGRYYLVCAGSIALNGKAYPAHSLAYSRTRAEARSLVAGERGAEVLMMQFPLAEKRRRG